MRGATRLAVLSTACDFGARAQWAYPGTCSQQTYTARYGKQHDYKPLFSDGAMPDIVSLSSDAIHAREFELSIAPALCHTPTVMLASSITAPTLSTSGIILNGVTASV
eukprot:PhM_4_TR18016/c0_g1_i4/m.33305